MNINTALKPNVNTDFKGEKVFLSFLKSPKLFHHLSDCDTHECLGERTVGGAESISSDVELR